MCSIITAHRIYKIYVSFDRRMNIITIFSHHFPLWMSMFDDRTIDSFLSWFYLTFSCCPKRNRFASVFFLKCVINNIIFIFAEISASSWIIITISFGFSFWKQNLIFAHYSIRTLANCIHVHHIYDCDSAKKYTYIIKVNEQTSNWHIFNSWRRINNKIKMKNAKCKSS